MDLITYKELEQILLTAIKMPTITIRQVSAETGIGKSGLYKWSRGENRISPDKADILLNWFKDCRPDALIAAETLYNSRGFRNDV